MNGVRHAVRMRLKKPGFTAIAALILTGAVAVVALKHRALAGLRERNATLGQQLEQLRRL